LQTSKKLNSDSRRDAELERYDVLFANMKAVMGDKEGEVSDLRVAVDELEARVRLEQKRNVELETYCADRWWPPDQHNFPPKNLLRICRRPLPNPIPETLNNLLRIAGLCFALVFFPTHVLATRHPWIGRNSRPGQGFRGKVKRKLNPRLWIPDQGV
jgi:hypothetical protein